jgi:hypothetical protein
MEKRIINQTQKPTEQEFEYKEQELVEIFNDTVGSVGYTIGERDTIFDPKTSKKIPMKDLYDVVNTRGGRVLFEDRLLVCRNNKVNEHFGIPIMDKYNPDTQGIIEVFKTGTAAQLEEILQYCSDGVMAKIVETAVNLPLDNLTLAQLIEEYSGRKIMGAIKEYQDEKLSKISLGEKPQIVNKTLDPSNPPRRTKQVVK